MTDKIDTSELRDALRNLESLPTLPIMLTQILNSAADPNTSALELGRFITADQSLSATILKIVNSAYYGFYRRVDSVPAAVVILGFLEVRNLAFTATAFKLMEPNGQRSAYDRTQLWRHSLATAIAAERCARRQQLVSDGGHYLCGLLHDLGKVAFDALRPEEFRKAAELAHARAITVAEAEREILGFDHAEAGGLIAEQWNMSTAVTDGIRYHHQPQSALGSAVLPSLTAVANAITYRAGLGESSNGKMPDVPLAAMEVIGLSEEGFDEVTEDIRQTTDKIDELIGLLSVG